MNTLHRGTVACPSRPPVFLQFGSGNFLRAFLDWMVQNWNDQTDFVGSVILLKSSPHPSKAFDQLVEQDGLYHLLTRGQYHGQTVDDHQLIDVVERVANPWEKPEAYLALAEIESLRFVLSNTTEAGICFDPADQFQDCPAESFPGKLTQLLYRRYTHFAGSLQHGFIFLPCELIPNNGEELQLCIIRYAQYWRLDDNFVAWIKEANTFCNTLVDRIVSGFPHNDKLAAQERVGFQDQLLVVAEPYHLLVIEAPPSVAQLLPWPALGLNVVFTPQLDAYRQQKVRILNGAHTAMVALGLLQGVETVKDAIAQPALSATLAEMIEQEIIPSLSLPADQLQAYTAAVMERFENPFIVHQLRDIALNSIAKFQTRLLPTLFDYHAKQGRLPAKLIQVFAALIRLYRGDIMPLRDDQAHIAFFQSQWHAWETHGDINQLSTAILGYEAAWGQDLNELKGLAEALGEALQNEIGLNQ
ncbi:MAG: tagaturonate reductase [Lewinella sp.]|nr:tagaturonate reductase [Lewinella sp.]